MGEKHWTKRSKETGQFMDQKEGANSSKACAGRSEAATLPLCQDRLQGRSRNRYATKSAGARMSVLSQADLTGEACLQRSLGTSSAAASARHYLRLWQTCRRILLQTCARLTRFGRMPGCGVRAFNISPTESPAWNMPSELRRTKAM